MPMPKPIEERSAGADRKPDTIPAAFWDRVARNPGKVALRYKRLGIWHEVTWKEFGEQVHACAYGLMALGVEPGGKVALLSEDRVEWFFADLGALAAGAVSVGVFATNSAEQCCYVVGHSEAGIWIVENQEQYDKVVQVRDRLPAVKYVILIDPTGVRGIQDPTVMTLDALRARGRKLAEERPELLERRMSAIRPGDTALLMYTSGTTGPPKGVMHSHRGFLEGARSALAAVGLNETDEGICYLPLSHIMERVTSYSGGFLRGATGSCAESPATLLRDLREVGPTGFAAVPRTWERLKAHIELGLEHATWLKRQAYRLALRMGYRWSRDRLGGARPTPGMRVGHWMAEWIVLRKLRERVGLHRLRMAFSGAAPIAPEVIQFFLALGVPMREGYGQTETGCTVFSPPNGLRLGTVGVPAPGVEFRTGEQDEILCRAPGLLQGYYKDPAGTAAKLRDGWFRSGDRGFIGEDGYLRLTGRVSDMMITSAGRNVAPQNLENMLKASNYIMDAVLIADGRPYLTALIAMDEETVSHWAQNHDVPFSSFADLAGRPEVVSLIEGEVRKANQRWSDREQILGFRILKWELTHGEEELTPTLKVRRKIICERYSDLIEEMYRHAAA
jgi:long-chain acyl-CoA synthetase